MSLRNALATLVSAGGLVTAANAGAVTVNERPGGDPDFADTFATRTVLAPGIDLVLGELHGVDPDECRPAPEYCPDPNDFFSLTGLAPGGQYWMDWATRGDFYLGVYVFDSDQNLLQSLSLESNSFARLKGIVPASGELVVRTFPQQDVEIYTLILHARRAPEPPTGLVAAAAAILALGAARPLRSRH
jgi:hypothetical protein